TGFVHRCSRIDKSRRGTRPMGAATRLCRFQRVAIAGVGAGCGIARQCVAETIDELGIDAGSLCLEITERAVVHDIESTRRTLTELKEVGVQIAIDDFGTGYAVLSHLKSLPVDMLKIDAQFVRDLGSNANDLAIIRAITGLAEAFGLQLVAEGVETPSAAMT